MAGFQLAPLLILSASSVTAAATLTPGQMVLADTTGGTFALALPTGQVEGSQCGVVLAHAGASPLQITGNIRGVTGVTDNMFVSGEVAIYQVDPSGYWYRIAAAGGVGNAFGFPYSIDPGILRENSADAVGVGAANRCIYLRVRGAGVISKIGLTVQTTSGNICVSVHQNSGVGRAAVPGARQATSGSVASTSGYQEISLGGSVAVNEGDWFGLSADNATVTFRSLLSTAGDDQLGLGRQFRQSTAFPAPSTPSSLTATVGNTQCLVGVS